MQPGGDVVNGQRQYTQRVPLLQSNWSADPIVTLQGGAAAGRLAQGTDIAVRAPLNGASQLRLDNAPLVFAGYGVQAPERQWDDFKGMDVRGKILVVFINDPDFDGPLADGGPDFGGKAMTYYGRWTYKYEQAAKLGAAGVLIVHEDAPASYGWATVKNSNTNTMFDVVRQNPAAAHPAMESWISRPPPRRSSPPRAPPSAQAKAAARRRDFKPVELPVRLSATGNAAAQTITSYNVVGLLPGTSPPGRDGDLLGALGPPRRRPARRRRRPHLQWRRRQCDRHRPCARAGALVRQGAAHPAQPVFLFVDRRGEGPARHRILCRPTRSTRWARPPACSTPMAARSTARRATSPSRARPSSACSTC